MSHLIDNAVQQTSVVTIVGGTPAGGESLIAATRSRRVRRLATVIASHPVVDCYAGFVTPLIGVLLVRCDLTGVEEASLIGIGSLASGISQPVFAWLADRLDTRVFAPLGLAIGAACLSSIGLATDYVSLIVLFVIGMIGVGAYHPIAAASAGQLSGRRRTVGITLFFTCGMIGATLGPLLSTRLTALDNGFMYLQFCMIPGLIMALVLHLMIRRVPHGHRRHEVDFTTLNHLRLRWFMVMLIFIGNALRYSVNMALVYLYVQWAEALTAQRLVGATPEDVAQQASTIAGNMTASTMFGMGFGGLLAGTLARRRHERALFVLIPILFAPAICGLTIAGPATGWIFALLAGVGFAAVIPVSVSAAQRLLPHRSSVASSLAMGGAWSVAAVAPFLAMMSLERFGLATTFLLTAGVLALSGLISIPLRTAGFIDAAPPREP